MDTEDSKRQDIIWSNDLQTRDKGNREVAMDNLKA